MSFNLAIFYALNSLAGQHVWFDAVVIFIANYLDGILILVTILMIILVYDPKPKVSYFAWEEMKQRLKGLGIVALSTSVAWVGVQILKAIFKAPRPYLVLPDVHLLFTYGGFNSFPSGHAAVFAALAVSLYIYNRTLGIVFGFFALLIGVTRVVSGIHFPIDIIVGYLLGGIIAWSFYFVYKKVTKKVTIFPWLKRLS